MKNQIIITQDGVQKKYHSRIACDKEKYVLNLLKGYDICPELLASGEKTSMLSFIDGYRLADITDDKNMLFPAFERVVDFVQEFNRLTENIVLDDINLKNFILSGNRIYGIDFESWHYGDSTDIYSAVLAMIETAYFSNTDEKIRLYTHIENYITDKTGLDRQIFSDKATEITTSIMLRRNAMKNIRQCDCVIIAGGKSSRMGRPKGLLNYNGYTFIDHIIYNSAVFDIQYISADDNAYSRFGRELIGDKVKDTGPLGAIYSALNRCEKEYVFFIPCDMPFVNEESIFQLFDKMDTGADAIIFSADGRMFPTVGIYKKNVLPQVKKQINSGNYRLMGLLNSVNTQYVEAKYPQQFKNINTPQDYSKI